MSTGASPMRVNPVRARLRAGGSAFGVMAFEFFTPGLAPVLAASGAEFVVLDMEHSGGGIETIKAQLAYCRGLDLVPLVRVPATQCGFMARLLDAGGLLASWCALARSRSRSTARAASCTAAGSGCVSCARSR